MTQATRRTPTAPAAASEHDLFGPSSAGAGWTDLRLLESPGDWYAIDVTGTANALRLATRTTGDAPVLFNNGLNPRMYLYDPSGALVASGLPLADGRNEFLQYQPSVAGTYRVCIVGEGTTS